MGLFRWPGSVAAALSVAGPAVVVGACVGLRGTVDNTNVALAVAVVVMVAALRTGFVGGAMAAVSGAVMFDLLQTKPYGSLRIAGTRDAVTTVLLLAVGVVAGVLEERRRLERRRDVATRDDFAHLQRLARLCAAGEDLDDLIAACEAELSDLLGLLDCRFERVPFDTTLTRLERHRAGRHKLVVHQEEVGPDWGSSDEVELPVRARDHQLGRFVLHLRGETFPLLVPFSAREVAFALADELGMVLAASWAAGPVTAEATPE